MNWGSALWLLTATPAWFFGSLFAPLSAGPLTMIPAAGALCLVAGVVLGVRARRRFLMAFALSILLSEGFVTAAGALRGSIHAPNPALLAFLAMQVVVIFALVWRSRRARTPAVLLGAFSLSYALFAAFVAAMAFSDTWV